MFVCPVPKLSQVMMKWCHRASHLGRFILLCGITAAELHNLDRFTLWHYGRLATQLSRFTLWHNRRWASQRAVNFLLLLFLFLFLFRTHKQLQYILHLQFITGNCYRLQKRNKKKKKDKVHKNTIVYILTIKRRQPASWSFIPHLPVCHLHFN